MTRREAPAPLLESQALFRRANPTKPGLAAMAMIQSLRTKTVGLLDAADQLFCVLLFYALGKGTVPNARRQVEFAMIIDPAAGAMVMSGLTAARLTLAEWMQDGQTEIRATVAAGSPAGHILLRRLGFRLVDWDEAAARYRLTPETVRHGIVHREPV